MPHDDASTPDVHPLRTQRFEKTCDGAPKSIGEVRRAASVWLGGAGLEESVRQRASLVVSELAANAVEAAPGAPFRVSIRIIGADVEIALTSRGRVDQLPPRPWEAPSASTPRGRGLAIVASLARRVGLDGGGDTLTITATLDTADT